MSGLTFCWEGTQGKVAVGFQQRQIKFDSGAGRARTAALILLPEDFCALTKVRLFLM